MEKEFDIAIIGAGPGGYIAALKAAELNARVALIERDQFGGTCLNLGCIPTKTLYQASRNFQNYLEYARLLKTPVVDDKALRSRAFEHASLARDKVIAGLRKQLEGLLKCSTITVYRGSAYLNSRREVIVDDHKKILADKVVIATGSTPIMPPQFDLDRTKVMTSDDVVSLKELPGSVLIVGGGYIGCEYATIFAHYGVEVTLSELQSGILNTEDDDVGKDVLKSFEKQGVTVYRSTGLESAQIDSKCVVSKLSNGRVLKTDLLLMAVGRSPNSKGLGLERLGITFSEQGAIAVDKKLRTSRPVVYAIGDVIDRELRLAHVSEKEGIIGISDILRDVNVSPMSYDVIPAAIFVEPEVASVGKREFQLEQEGAVYVVSKALHERNVMAQCTGNTTGFVKLLVDTATHKLLGGTIVGDHASDLIGIIATAMNGDTTIETLINSVWFHPSRPEAIKSAAEIALRKLTR